MHSINGRISAAPRAQFNPTLNTYKHKRLYRKADIFVYTEKARFCMYLNNIYHAVPLVISFATEIRLCFHAHLSVQDY